MVPAFVAAQSEAHPVQIKLNPLPAVDGLTFPTLNFGFEIGLTKHISWYSEFGLKYRKAYYEQADSAFMPAQGFKVSWDFRYYFNSKPGKRQTGLYVGISPFYRNDTHNAEISYKDKVTGAEYKDRYSSERTVVGGRATVGLQQHYDGVKYLDWFAGIGLGHRTVQTVAMAYDDDFHDLTFQTVTPANELRTMDVKAERRLVFSISVGIRLSFKLGTAR